VIATAKNEKRPRYVPIFSISHVYNNLTTLKEVVIDDVSSLIKTGFISMKCMMNFVVYAFVGSFNDLSLSPLKYTRAFVMAGLLIFVGNAIYKFLIPKMYKNTFWYIFWCIFAIDKCLLKLIFVQHILPVSTNGVKLRFGFGLHFVLW